MNPKNNDNAPHEREWIHAHFFASQGLLNAQSNRVFPIVGTASFRSYDALPGLPLRLIARRARRITIHPVSIGRTPRFLSRNKNSQNVGTCIGLLLSVSFETESTHANYRVPTAKLLFQVSWSVAGNWQCYLRYALGLPHSHDLTGFARRMAANARRKRPRRGFA